MLYEPERDFSTAIGLIKPIVGNFCDVAPHHSVEDFLASTNLPTLCGEPTRSSSLQCAQKGSSSSNRAAPF